ncbi:hypothetical protein [Levilactobacillus brevis]|uniref:hypothetical protein n=1 Tax=Levilactobacillus brevis TaxID=1580 RepID=UPI001119732B|nr:hypothetical protein [Levilactobacillus brevis]QCZ46820.1 Hypothetical protein UCCLB556_1945 [Levilactobacillus brevis]
MIYRTLEVLAGNNENENQRRYSVGSFAELKNITINTSFNEVFKLIPYRQSVSKKNKVGNSEGNEYEIKQFSKIDSAQKKGVFGKAITMMGKGSLLAQLCVEAEDNTSLVEHLKEIKFTQKMKFNAYYLVIFMMLLSSYEMFKAGNDTEDESLKLERLKGTNSQAYIDYWFQYYERNSSKVANDDLRTRLGDQLSSSDPIFAVSKDSNEMNENDLRVLMKERADGYLELNESEVRRVLPVVEWDESAKKDWNNGVPLKFKLKIGTNDLFLEIAEFYNYLLFELPKSIKTGNFSQRVRLFEYKFLVGFFEFATRGESIDRDTYMPDFENQAKKVISKDEKEVGQLALAMRSAFTSLSNLNPIYGNQSTIIAEIKQISGNRFSDLALDYNLLIEENEKSLRELTDNLSQLGAKYQRHLGKQDLAHRVAMSYFGKSKVPANETLLHLRLNERLKNITEKLRNLEREAGNFDPVFKLKDKK